MTTMDHVRVISIFCIDVSDQTGQPYGSRESNINIKIIDVSEQTGQPWIT